MGRETVGVAEVFSWGSEPVVMAGGSMRAIENGLLKWVNCRALAMQRGEACSLMGRGDARFARQSSKMLVFQIRFTLQVVYQADHVA